MGRNRNKNKNKNKNKKRNDEAPTPLQLPPTVFDTIEVPTPLQSLPTVVDTIEAPTRPSSTTSSDDSDEAASTIVDGYDLLSKMRWGSFKRKSHLFKNGYISKLRRIVTPQGNLSCSICITDDEDSVQIPKESVEDSRVEKREAEIDFEKKREAEIDFEIEEASADVSQGALEGNMVSFVRYPNIEDANLNMHILQTAGIEEIVSPLTVIKSSRIWLAIERINYTLHDYMKQSSSKWCHGKLDDTTKILVRDIIGGVTEAERQGFVAKLNAKDIGIINGRAKLMKLSSSNGCQLLMQRQKLKTLMEELLGPCHNSKELGDFYSRVNRFPTCRLGHLRNHPLLLTSKERFLLPVIATILLDYGTTASTWKKSYNEQFESHKVDIEKKVKGDREYLKIFTHREMKGYKSTPANQVVFSRNAKTHLNDEHQFKTLEKVEEDLNGFFPNMLPDLSAFLMDQGIDAFHKENDKYGEDVLSRLHSILKLCKLKNGDWDTKYFCKICRSIFSLIEICSYMMPRASQSRDLSSILTDFKEKIQGLESHFLKNQYRFRNLRLMSQDPVVVNSKLLFSFFQCCISHTRDFIWEYTCNPKADVSKLVRAIIDELDNPQEFHYLLKYVPNGYQLKELLANPKDIRCGSSIASFLFQLASHLGELADDRAPTKPHC